VGWLYIDQGRPFASLWGGSTLAGYRKQGYYTALLAVRLQEAIQRGARFLTIDASPMSRPIVQRFGFRQITTACDYTWEPPQ
ncbi:MAG: GNAT family N-acetyltransferase, partial [Anaerolineae bacterium]|nr:GNAT family N-acetyltransferase [Anaerolineae bacterium]MCB0240283.1 GNAT family N-acetyltransferase [Anaerolineae bacterium]